MSGAKRAASLTAETASVQWKPCTVLPPSDRTRINCSDVSTPPAKVAIPRVSPRTVMARRMARLLASFCVVAKSD
jgi:hypothetical protein